MLTHTEAEKLICEEWRELRALGKVQDGHAGRSDFWSEREDQIRFRTEPGVDPWQYVQGWLNECDPG